jgi:hypothetical protein
MHRNKVSLSRSLPSSGKLMRLMHDCESVIPHPATVLSLVNDGDAGVSFNYQ